MTVNKMRKALCDTKTMTVEQAISTMIKRECYMVFRKSEYIIDIMDIYTDKYYGSCGAHPVFFDKSGKFIQDFRLNRVCDGDDVAVYEVFYNWR